MFKASLLVYSIFTLPLMAITIQDSNLSSYVTGSSNYTGVVEITFQEGGNGYLCSGALIASTYILTAGHCVNGASNWQVTFQTASGTSTLGVSNSYLEPLFSAYPSGNLSSLYAYDVAVLQLSSAAPSDATIYGVDTNFAGVTVGQTALTLVGYGLGGNPSVGIETYGTRRAAQQVVQSVASSLYGVSTPDNPLIMTMSFPSSEPAANAPKAGYGLINGGDSGGPALLGNTIVGINDFGDLPSSGNYQSGVQYLTGEQNLSNASIGAFVTQFVATPEPATMLLGACGIIALAALRRRQA
ncbi:MAG: trypsin-like serine protease [Acidobacteriota bacterium]|nr:trypsin-like serine protease [Acidobacteriota bacterium]